MIAERSVLNGRYQLDRKIGRGGFARVFLATDLLLKRQVAIKVLDPELTDDASFLARFEQEAQRVAILDHPNILTIHDYGQVEGTAYLVMPYIPGGTLQDKICADQPLGLEQAGDYLRQAAAALDYAHRRNLVHRDVKPQNMLLRDDDARLLLADFGIAKVLSSTSTQSRTGIVGTISYMAPEQFQGNVNRATDVYALGCVLFQMLTGELPYTGTTEQVMYGHLAAPIPALAERGGEPSLQEVINRALAKRLEERFQSTGEFAQAFQTVVASSMLTGPAASAGDTWHATAVSVQPTQQSTTRLPLIVQEAADSLSDRTQAAESLPPQLTPAARVFHKSRQVALLGGAGAILAILLVAAIVASVSAANRPKGDSFGTAVPTNPLALALSPTPTPSAPAAIATPPPAIVLTVTASSAPTVTATGDVAPTQTRAAEIAALATLVAPAPTPSAAPIAMATMALTPTATPRVPVIGAVFRGQSVATLAAHKEYVVSVAWSPDSKTLASGSYDNTIRLWGADGRQVATLIGHTDAVVGVAWSPDGKTLASGAADNGVRLWSATGRHLATLSGHTSSVFCVAWSPDGRTIASGSGKIGPNDNEDYTMRLWSTEGQLLATLPGHTSSILSVAWSPDGKTLASASADNTVRLWSAEGRPLATLSGHTDRVIGVAWSPDGKTLASASGDSTIRLWSPDGRPLTIFSGHTNYVTSVAWSPDSKTLASGSYDRTIRLWNADGKTIAVLTGHTDSVRGVAWSPDGRILASASLDNTIRLWQ